MNIKDIYRVLRDEPKFRAKQVNKLIYQDLIGNWDEASTLPKDLRLRLNEECSLDIDMRNVQLVNGGAKAVLVLEDGNKVETVLVRNGDGRHTICVSSQIGCKLGCAFCATGKMKFERNLNKYEIVEQVLYFARFLKEKGEKVNNIVYMGMGEPMLNIDNVLDSIKILNDDDCFNLGARKISISTVGIKDGINKIIDSKLQVNLAISLHATDDITRSRIMPINKSVNISDLFKIIDKYLQKTNRKVMIEYLLLKGINDSMNNAMQLAKLLRGRLCMVNLIKYNKTGGFESSDKKTTRIFHDILQQNGIEVSVRNSKVQEANGACGQLAGK